ncbi:MAG: hypothetical protein PHH44_01875 [bacterium]|nr:hypothetical protein [bacterium]
MENNLDIHYLSKIRSNMQRLDFQPEEQEEIVKYCNALKSISGFNKIFKKLSNRSIKHSDFVNDSFELLIGYSLRKYSLEYEKVYCNRKKPDITINMNNKSILLEIKKKSVSSTERVLDSIFNEYKPKMIAVLNSKYEQKYSCILDFQQIRKDYFNKDRIKGNFDNLLEGLKKASIEENELVLLKDRKVEISLKMVAKNDTWSIIRSEGAEINDEFTYGLLKNVIYNKDNKNKENRDSIFSKFIGRDKNDITIGIIDARRKSLCSVPMETEFLEPIAIEILKNILNVDNLLIKEPQRTVYDWYKEVRNSIDAILLILKMKNDLLGIKAFINDNITEENKKIVNEIAYEMNSIINRYSYYWLV